VTAYSVHPGVIKTNLQSGYEGWLGKVMRASVAITPTVSVREGAHTSLYCATSPEAPGRGAGKYFLGPKGKVQPR